LRWFHVDSHRRSALQSAEFGHQNHETTMRAAVRVVVQVFRLSNLRYGNLHSGLCAEPIAERMWLRYARWSEVFMEKVVVKNVHSSPSLAVPFYEKVAGWLLVLESRIFRWSLFHYFIIETFRKIVPSGTTALENACHPVHIGNLMW